MLGKISNKVTKKMTLTYLAGYKKFLEKSLAEHPEVTVPELIERINETLAAEGFELPAEVEDQTNG